ncbi:hypothetical protein Vafri_4102 [Volvox africanus]|uniref:Uncharacterized protein n=1 Tax=Volvox africanus TaxID=51714 RepID=A0A8J4ETI8_9CHLO|nr:hypothetical protein Vafri_4102 [Volvox africanus]
MDPLIISTLLLLLLIETTTKPPEELHSSLSSPRQSNPFHHYTSEYGIVHSVRLVTSFVEAGSTPSPPFHRNSCTLQRPSNRISSDMAHTVTHQHQLPQPLPQLPYLPTD